MKTAYTYVTLRYVHDVVTGEFVNVGVVVFAPQQRFLEARLTESYLRLNAMFLQVDDTHYRRIIRYLNTRFGEMADELKNDLNFLQAASVDQIVRQVLPQDDSSLQWSEMGAGLSENPAETVNFLSHRYVEKYMKETESKSRSDEEVAKPFRTRIAKVSSKLQEKVIATKDFEYQFEAAWKNSMWHLYEPVSFDLLEPKSILDKASRWLGRGVALQDSPEKFKIHFILGEPRVPGNAKAFEQATHLLEKIPGEKELIREQDLPEFAEKVVEEIEKHAA